MKIYKYVVKQKQGMDVEFLNKNFRVRAYCKDNIIFINAEDTAREFGFIKNN